jgi:hypothetical protein
MKKCDLGKILEKNRNFQVQWLILARCNESEDDNEQEKIRTG